MAAHVGVGIFLIALLWWLFPKTSVARTLLFLAILLVTVAPTLGDFLKGFGSTLAPMKTEQDALLISSCLVFLAVLVLRRFLVAIVALLMAALLLKMQDWVQDSLTELCALHAIWIGTALGLIRRRAPIDRAVSLPARLGGHRSQDVVIFAVATIVGVFASVFVLSRANGSADEWAYTWQAAVFAKGHIHAGAPPCENAFQNFYVFETVGRLFAQYTPGWPYFMAPFAAVGVPWLAGPFAHGLMAVGVARVARSTVRLDGAGSAVRVSASGWIAALVATLGSTILLVGASRYSHIFVAALFAWAIEALLVFRIGGLSPARQVRWGVILGSSVALLGATRPADGATLSIGLAGYFVFLAITRRVSLRAFAASFASFAFWGGLTLVILRVQLGSWLTTGYSLEKIIHPWNVPKYGWPRPSEWKFALPLATGTYAWFPCSLAVGLAGIASLRRGARALIAIIPVAFVCFETYYQYIDLGRGFDWGYGPRYETPFVVPMAVGMGIALAPLAESAMRRVSQQRAYVAGGPFAIVVCLTVMTLIRLWPLLYPGVYAHVHQHDSLNQRIRDAEIHHAIVVAQTGATGFDPLDLTENLPIDLYPHQDVLIAIERNRPEFARCLRASFPDRTMYRATGNPVVITPY